MQGIYYTDKNFVYESSTKSILSIRYATDGFSFCVHDENDKLVVFAHQPFQADSLEAVIAKIKNFIVNDRILNLNYRKVYMISCSKTKSLIPSAFFQKEKLSTIYNLQHEIDKEEKIIYHHIENLDAYLVESIPEKFDQFLRERYPVIQIANSAFNLIFEATSKTLQKMDQLFIDIQKDYFDVLLFRDASLQLFNAFQYQADTDIVYFILNIIKETRIESEKVHLSLSGQQTDNPKFKELLETYIPHLYYLKEPLLNTILQDKTVNSSCFIHLLNYHQCGL